MSYFSATEHDRYLYLIPLFEKTPGMLDLELKIVILGLGTHLDFFKFDPSRLFFGLGCLLARLILVFAVIHDPANGRRRIGGNFYEIETTFLSGGQSLFKTQYPELPTFVVDNPDFPGTNGPVNVGFWLSYGATS